jgi:hypothetical protein
MTLRWNEMFGLGYANDRLEKEKDVDSLLDHSL